MARKKEKPDFSKIDAINPYSMSLTVRISKRYTDVINKFGNADIIEHTMESTRYTKVFEQTGVNEVITKLPIRCKEMYLHVLYHLEAGMECIWFSRDSYMKTMGIKSLTTFRDTIRKLEDKALMMPIKGYPDTYWINPHYFFKGSRPEKYPDRVFVVNENENKKK